MQTNPLELALLAVAAYLVGSIPFGLLLTKLLGRPDPRGGGSGNIGATNVARLAGKPVGVATLALDVAKGYTPAALALAWLGHWPAAVVGLAAFIGHLWPIYLRFKGGKGVATALGVWLALSPLALAGIVAMLVGGVLITGHMSVGSLAGASSAPVLLWFVGQPAVVAGLSLVMTVLIFWRHRANLARLAQGREHSWR